MSLHSTLLATCLVELGFLIAPPPTIAQAPDPDTTARAAADSLAVKPDSTAGADSLPASRDSATAARDSLPAARDSVRPPGTGSATTSRTAPPRNEPVDSILRAACSGPAGATTVARDLLVVVFAPEAAAAERAAAAKSVDGRLLGPVTSGEPGAYYLRVPSGGEESRLRVAADQLIQLDMVWQVGSRACPSLPPPDTARRNSP